MRTDDEYWTEVREAVGPGLPWYMWWAGVTRRQLDRAVAVVRQVTACRCSCHHHSSLDVAACPDCHEPLCSLLNGRHVKTTAP